MNKTTYTKLLNSSTDSATFVVSSKKELHKQVREYLAFAVGAFVENTKTLNDARIAIKVALEYNRAYAPVVRSVMSQVHSVQTFKYSADNVITSVKADKPRVPLSIEQGVKLLNEKLDAIDSETARPEVTAEQKLSRAAKSFNTSLINIEADKLNEAIKQLSGLTTDDCEILYATLNSMMLVIEPKLILAKAA